MPLRVSKSTTLGSKARAAVISARGLRQPLRFSPPRPRRGTRSLSSGLVVPGRRSFCPWADPRASFMAGHHMPKRRDWAIKNKLPNDQKACLPTCWAPILQQDQHP